MSQASLTAFHCRTLVLALITALTGCGALQRTDFVPPATQTPAQWTHRTTGQEVEMAPWWQAFGDDALNRLIDQALRTNNNLAVAALKVRRAQLLAGLATDARRPALTAGVNSAGNKRLDQSGGTFRSGSANLTVSYEADLWGRLAANEDAQRWEALATEQDRQSTALSLIGTTAELYWQGAYLNQRLATSLQNIAYAQTTLELVRTRHQAGAVSALDVLQAEQTLTGLQATHTGLLQQQVENDNALAILFDSPPGQRFALPARLPQQALPALAAGLPADLLARRPDLRAAELRLREALATVDATRLNYYPRLNLTGALGTSSDALLDLLKNPIATLGAGLTLPFLQYNAMRLNVQVSQADYESAVANFRQALYAAFSDVENALSARRQTAQQEQLLRQNLAAAQQVEQLYALRYRAGSATLQNWLDAQDKRRAAEIALAETRLNRLKNQMTLYQALGGGLPAPT